VCGAGCAAQGAGDGGGGGEEEARLRPLPRPHPPHQLPRPRQPVQGRLWSMQDSFLGVPWCKYCTKVNMLKGLCHKMDLAFVDMLI
jgi:hypothetical protein